MATTISKNRYRVWYAPETNIFLKVISTLLSWPKGMVYYNAYPVNSNGIHMQFTGMADQCKCAVYEGDIINTKANRYKVVWNNATAAFEAVPLFFGKTEPCYLNSIIGNGFIMGNIHQNPELLGL